MKCQIILVILGVLFNIPVYSQNSTYINNVKGEPLVGQPCPDYHFSQVDFYIKKSISISDFKGKWLILDFWNKDCSGCIANFPRVNEEQILFKGKVQFLMVSNADKKKENKTLY